MILNYIAGADIFFFLKVLYSRIPIIYISFYAVIIIFPFCDQRVLMVLCAADSVLTEKVVSGLIVTVVSLQTEFAVICKPRVGS